MVYRCLITLFSTWSDFNWQRETAFFFASNRWIQGSATKRHADFSRAWHRKGYMKLNGELPNAPFPLSSPPEETVSQYARTPSTSSGRTNKYLNLRSSNPVRGQALEQ